MLLFKWPQIVSFCTKIDKNIWEILEPPNITNITLPWCLSQDAITSNCGPIFHKPASKKTACACCCQVNMFIFKHIFFQWRLLLYKLMYLSLCEYASWKLFDISKTVNHITIKYIFWICRRGRTQIIRGGQGGKWVGCTDCTGDTDYRLLALYLVIACNYIK